MEIGEIKALVELFERSTLTELTIERGGTKLTLKREAPRTQEITTRIEEAPPPHIQRTDHYAIKSPIVGVFYRRPAPDEEPFVEVGDRVEVGDTVCIIEAMKVMNEVKTERAGIVSEILAEDGKPVEYGQELIVIKPI